MPSGPTSSLDPMGQLFETQFVTAFEAFLAGRFDEANGICRWLISKPKTGRYHRAGYVTFSATLLIHDETLTLAI